jgi:rfaE bifunctional protein nucleotidyltransferase chain/domain
VTRSPLRLLVVGDTLLDRDVEGTVTRVCPDAPAPVVDVTAVRDRPGGAGLAALLAARPGVVVTLATGLGSDAAGRRVLRLLDGVATVHAVLGPATTPGKTRVRSGGHTLVRLDDAGHLLGAPERAADAGTVDEAAFEALVLSSDAVLVADYGGAVTRSAAVRSVLQRNAATVPVVWDPHPRGEAPVPGVRVVTPNRAEAVHFAGPAGPTGPTGPAQTGDPLPDLAARLVQTWGVSAVAVTDGDRGALVVDAGADPVVCSATPCPPPVDTCGAGDRFAGAVALGLAAGRVLADAVQAATEDVARWLRSGGVSGGTVGPVRPVVAPVRPADVLEAVGEPAEDLLARIRGAGGVTVATGGCFDLLHAGHLELLRAARALGDCLVVLLNSDASTRRLKGPGRPVTTAADRARLLEALRFVDAVVVFENDDPRATLDRLRPDVWVKGGDYRVEDLPEADVVHAYGGRVELVRFLDGHSTTGTLQRVGASAGVPGSP